VGSARRDVGAYGEAPFLGSMGGTPLNGLLIDVTGF
jgi:hypothetical protein